jgi:putative sterol carrier protein
VEPDPEATAMLFDGLRRQIDASVAPAATIQWDFSDAEPWHLRLDNGNTSVSPGRAADPDLTFHCRFADWVDIAAGRTEPWRALLAGKVRPSGRVRMLLRARKLFA